MVDFGVRLRNLRQAKGLTQKQLAGQLSLTKSVISAYETGLRMPSYDILIQIASVFNVTTDFLLGVENKQLTDLSGLSSKDFQLILNVIERLKNNS